MRAVRISARIITQLGRERWGETNTLEKCGEQL
jgi:hypothetical protein